MNIFVLEILSEAFPDQTIEIDHGSVDVWYDLDDFSIMVRKGFIYYYDCSREYGAKADLLFLDESDLARYLGVDYESVIGGYRSSV